MNCGDGDDVMCGDGDDAMRGDGDDAVCAQVLKEAH